MGWQLFMFSAYVTGGNLYSMFTEPRLKLESLQISYWNKTQQWSFVCELYILYRAKDWFILPRYAWYAVFTMLTRYFLSPYAALQIGSNSLSNVNRWCHFE